MGVSALRPQATSYRLCSAPGATPNQRRGEDLRAAAEKGIEAASFIASKELLQKPRPTTRCPLRDREGVGGKGTGAIKEQKMRQGGRGECVLLRRGKGGEVMMQDGGTR